MSSPRLTDEVKAAILAAYVDGLPVKIIAERFNCDPSYPPILAKRRGIEVRRPKPPRPALSRMQQRLIDALASGPRDNDDLAGEVGCTIGTLRVLVHKIREKGGPGIESINGYRLRHAEANAP